MHRYIVDIYEATMDYPVVTHIFNGKTVAEALGYYRAHLGSDAFLAGCVQGHYKNIGCRIDAYWSVDSR